MSCSGPSGPHLSGYRLYAPASYNIWMDAKTTELVSYLRGLESAVLALSGGLDSVFLMKAISMSGIRTLAVAPDDEVREQLHSPWRESGFVLAPMVLGYGMAYFRW